MEDKLYSVKNEKAGIHTNYHDLNEARKSYNDLAKYGEGTKLIGSEGQTLRESPKAEENARDIYARMSNEDISNHKLQGEKMLDNHITRPINRSPDTKVDPDDYEEAEMIKEGINDDEVELARRAKAMRRGGRKETLADSFGIEGDNVEDDGSEELTYKVADMLKKDISNLDVELETLSQIEGVGIEEIKQREPMQIAKALVEEGIVDSRMFEDQESDLDDLDDNDYTPLFY